MAATAPAPLPLITMPLAAMLRHEAENGGIAAVTTTSGEQIFVAESLEVGPDWLFIRTGYGEGRHAVLVPLSAVAAITLR